MNELLKGIKDRRIWRVLVAYPSITFIWLQAVEFFINNYGLDPRLLTASIIIALALFPAAVTWNWRHGEVGTQAVAKGEVGAYVFFAVAAVALVGWYWSGTSGTTPVYDAEYRPARSIAVLPFENASDDVSVQFLCDGIAESLINWLSTVPNIKVVSKSAAFRIRDATDDVAAIANNLGVDGIVLGRLEKIGDQIIVSTSFVDARNESQLWGDRLIRPVGELIYLERSIVDSIKGGLRLEVEEARNASTASTATDDPQAYEHYLRGHYLIQSTNLEEIYSGLDELRVAIDLDPNFALADADIADALVQMVAYGIEHEESLVLEAQRSAYTAVSLAPDLAEAQSALAIMFQFVNFEWQKADAAFQAAVALQPQSPVPYHRYSDYLSLMLQPTRALEVARIGLAKDALDSSSMHAVAIAAMVAGDFPLAAENSGEWNRFHPNSRWSYVKHALMLSLDGRCELAVDQGRKVEQLVDGKPSTLMDAWIAWGYKNCGAEEDYARSKARIEARMQREPNVYEPGFAYLFALEGNNEALIDFIQRTAEEREPFTTYLQVFAIPGLGLASTENIRADPRYLAVVDKLGFPPGE
jgi:TolB-like protein